MVSGVYSGECKHLSALYDGERTEYSVVMIDQLPQKSDFYFSTIFSFYAGYNEFADWNLATSRKEMSSYWLDHGAISQISESKTKYVMVPYEDGSPAYIYYLRQNPMSKELYYITLAGQSQISFCRLKKN